MRSISLERHGKSGAFQLKQLSLPVAKDGELRIKVKASGLNFADILARQGIYPDCPPLPCVIGYEVSGVVDAVGEGADPRWLGQEVMALTDFGAYADWVCVDQGYVWRKPEALSFAQAAAIPLNYITAWALVKELGALDEGQTVLIHNAGGGVGLAAMDIALWLGATIIATASAAKHEFIRQRGAHHVVDYRRKDWDTRVMEISDGRGVELALDPIGGAHWKQSFRLLRKTGRLGMYGISSASAPGVAGKLGLLKLFANAPVFHPAQVIPGNRGVFGVNVHAMYEESEKFQRWMNRILKGLDEGWVRPHVDRCFSFEQVEEAHHYVEQRRNLGKVILLPG